MKHFFPFTLALVLSAVCVTCDAPNAVMGVANGYGKLVAEAEAAEARGQYITAAERYRDAYAARPGKPEHAYQAAELYARARDYRNASESYALVPPNDARWPLLGLSYGRVLKQAGQPRGAERVLNNFVGTYNGTDRSIVLDLAQIELAGLRLPREEDPDVNLTRLGGAVNTASNETSPSLATAERLYVVSQQAGGRRAVASQYGPTGWERSAAPPGFPVIRGGELGTGSWSTDGGTYFFTICSEGTAAGAQVCEIYRTGRRLSGAWIQPIKLGATVNAPGANNAYPSAISLEDGRQVLYFASNRAGGAGGLDIYRATQISAANPAGFEEAAPVAPNINTPGNEITPVFDRNAQRLTFASNGHPGYGGYDLFRATRVEGRYGKPENLGRPLNSAADDYGMTLPGATGLAFLASNRAALPDKASTTDDDVFQFGVSLDAPTLQATVYAQASRQRVNGAEVRLIDINRGGTGQPVATQTAADGAYYFTLAPATSYRVEIRHPNYQASNYRVKTDESGYAIYGRPVYLLEKGARPQVPSPGEQEQRPPPTPTPRPDPTPAMPEPDEAATDAPTVYRIQVSATREYDPTEPRYQYAATLGPIRSEAIPGRTLNRITVGYYTRLEDARVDMAALRDNGFEDAYIVRYDEGKRYGRVR